jgi:hypothetical protein
MLVHILPTIHPNRQRCIRGILPGLEEPEVSVDSVRLVFYTQVRKCIGGKMDITGETSDAFCSLTEIGLIQ